MVINMKKNFNLLLFIIFTCVFGILDVSAAGPMNGNMARWDSVIGEITTALSNNCISSLPLADGTHPVDTFIVGSKCIMTGIKEGEHIVVSQADPAGGTGVTYTGTISAANNSSTDGYIKLEKIVELLYTGETVKEWKNDMFAEGVDVPEGATSYIIKAGSDDSFLYLAGGYDNQALTTVAIPYNATTHKLSYNKSLTSDEEGWEEHLLITTFFNSYFTDLLMEASPNNDKLATAMNEYEQKVDSDKMDTAKFMQDYLGVLGKYLPVYETSADIGPTATISLKVEALLKEGINDDLIVILNKAVAGDYYTTGTKDDDKEDNPNTGAFVNITILLVLLGVGIAVIRWNPTKMYKI